uniref:Cyclin N-terminal domain-containing protein n=1 Tax=Macrostomum lignano TaxID=282301 RepID=A0A1I8FGZ2_9PLAT
HCAAGNKECPTCRKEAGVPRLSPARSELRPANSQDLSLAARSSKAHEERVLAKAVKICQHAATPLPLAAPAASPALSSVRTAVPRSASVPSSSQQAAGSTAHQQQADDADEISSNGSVDNHISSNHHHGYGNKRSRDDADSCLGNGAAANRGGAASSSARIAASVDTDIELLLKPPAQLVRRPGRRDKISENRVHRATVAHLISYLRLRHSLDRPEATSSVAAAAAAAAARGHGKPPPRLESTPATCDATAAARATEGPPRRSCRRCARPRQLPQLHRGSSATASPEYAIYCGGKGANQLSATARSPHSGTDSRPILERKQSPAAEGPNGRRQFSRFGCAVGTAVRVTKAKSKCSAASSSRSQLAVWRLEQQRLRLAAAVARRKLKDIDANELQGVAALLAGKCRFTNDAAPIRYTPWRRFSRPRLPQAAILRSGSTELVASVCFFIACKVVERFPPKVSKLVYLTDNAYTNKEFLGALELSVLEALEFAAAFATVSTQFLARLLEASACDLRDQQHGDGKLSLHRVCCAYIADLVGLLDLDLAHQPASSCRLHLASVPTLMFRDGCRPGMPPLQHYQPLGLRVRAAARCVAPNAGLLVAH